MPSLDQPDFCHQLEYAATYMYMLLLVLDSSIVKQCDLERELRETMTLLQGFDGFLQPPGLQLSLLTSQ